jgi:hypothetical protein
MPSPDLMPRRSPVQPYEVDRAEIQTIGAEAVPRCGTRTGQGDIAELAAQHRPGEQEVPTDLVKQVVRPSLGIASVSQPPKRPATYGRLELAITDPGIDRLGSGEHALVSRR